jgi:hypothetical protein
LRRAPEISGDGLVAAYDGTDVTIATPDGIVTGSFAGVPPLQWSPSGRYVAAGGEVATADGKKTPDFPRVDGVWFAWSPVADCMIFGGRRSLRLVAPGRDEVVLLREKVSDLAFSPNGKRVALVLGEGRLMRLVIVDLESGRVVRAPFPAEVVMAILGWTPDSTALFYGTASGASISADGVRIRLLPVPRDIGHLPRVTPTTYRASAVAAPDFYEPCGTSSVIVEGSGRESTGNKRLVTFDPVGGTRPLTSVSDWVHISPACSPGGRYIAAIRAPDRGSVDDRHLVVLSRDGSFLDDLTPLQAGADEYPSWGPAGVVFVNRPTSGAPEVWFIPEGGTARSTGLTVQSPRDVYGHFEWSRFLDWSGDAPSGSAAGV